jgi:hypothetical protein
MPTFRSGQPIARQFRRLNDLGRSVSAAGQEVINLRHRTEGGRASFNADFRHPFQVYQIPIEYRDSPDPNSDWRRFVIRAGRVFETDCSGTDGADANPDSEAIGDDANELLVPEVTPKWWIWIEIGKDAYDATTAVIRYSDTPNSNSYSDGNNPSWTSNAAWTGAPKPDSTHIPIAWVDTDTDNATHEAHVRQLLRADVISVGGSGVKFRGEWSTGETYAKDDLVIWSSSGPGIGAYVALSDGLTSSNPPWEGATAGVGWAKLPTGMGPWL